MLKEGEYGDVFWVLVKDSSPQKDTWSEHATNLGGEGPLPGSQRGAGSQPSLCPPPTAQQSPSDCIHSGWESSTFSIPGVNRNSHSFTHLFPYPFIPLASIYGGSSVWLAYGGDPLWPVVPLCGDQHPIQELWDSEMSATTQGFWDHLGHGKGNILPSMAGPGYCMWGNYFHHKRQRIGVNASDTIYWFIHSLAPDSWACSLYFALCACGTRPIYGFLTLRP